MLCVIWFNCSMGFKMILFDTYEIQKGLICIRFYRNSDFLFEKITTQENIFKMVKSVVEGLK